MANYSTPVLLNTPLDSWHLAATISNVTKGNGYIHHCNSCVHSFAFELSTSLATFQPVAGMLSELSGLIGLFQTPPTQNVLYH
jgi:hypothetical protein